ncbi:glycosyltransferase family 4 protein [Verrucomicrobiota bacterium]
MKVLWFTGGMLPKICREVGLRPSVTGGFMSSLADIIADSGEIELGVASCSPNIRETHVFLNNVEYYAVPVSDMSKMERYPDPDILNACVNIAKDFDPDIVHVHGTEYFYGILTADNHINCPSVISIQGFLGACWEHYYGGISERQLFLNRSLSDSLFRAGLFEQKRNLQRRINMETEIIRKNSAFMGRTTWDKSYLQRINPDACYYHCDETLRPAFHSIKWSFESVIPQSIFVSTGAIPLKGLHVMLKALSLISGDFPDVTLRLAHTFPKGRVQKPSFIDRMKGQNYRNYLYSLIAEMGLHSRIISLGELSASEMAEELAKANVFVVPSFIENSPNSLCEAMMVGTPCIASFTGGIPSLVQDRRNALCFQAGDEISLARCLRIVLARPDLSKRISCCARATALNRHDNNAILNRVTKVYHKVLKKGLIR